MMCQIITDTDIDGDGINDEFVFAEMNGCPDTDGDGIGNNEDLDDDGDGYPILMNLLIAVMHQMILMILICL